MAQRKQSRSGAGRARTAPPQTRARPTSGAATKPRPAARGNSATASTPSRAAKWVDGVDVHADHAGQSLATRDHDVIRRWATVRGAVPATTGTPTDGKPPWVLRFDFPALGGTRLRAIPWKTWLETFDARGLVFLYQEHKKDGSQSNFFRLDEPQRSGG